MKLYEFVAPCHFGMESVLKREILDIGYDVTEVEDGRVVFEGDMEALCRGNVFLRTAERVLLRVGKFKALTFEELFEKTKELPWEEFIPENGKFWVVKASSVKSRLFSTSDIQSLVKKAVVEKLKIKYNKTWFEEDGSEYPIRVFLLKDEVTIALDTTGDSLHKRGYRQQTSKAPITETLAAGLIMLTPWHGDRILVDPFCGSGTIPIEAAMMAANIAPGMNRSFLSEGWKNLISRKLWYETINEANDIVKKKADTDIQAYDIDWRMVKLARENAREAGVEEMIHFQQRELKDFSHPKKYGFVITNPPYGERLQEKSEMPELYTEIGRKIKAMDTWSYYIISGYEEAEKYIGRKADRNRKIYNGMLKTYYYQFLGKKPPKQKRG
jgi:putative N6-adenine-specific DNA methylase